MELLTYVDYIEHGGAAHMAGLRAGDTILSINGISMETADHSALVNFVKGCTTSMRYVVVELGDEKVDRWTTNMRYILVDQVVKSRSLDHFHEVRSGGTS